MFTIQFRNGLRENHPTLESAQESIALRAPKAHYYWEGARWLVWATEEDAEADEVGADALCVIRGMPCEHCAKTLPFEECGWAEVEARWVDEEGESARIYRICNTCLNAGSSTLGYRLA